MLYNHTMNDLIKSDPLLQKAYQFAATSMVGKTRHSGELFVDHCASVVKILQQFGVNDLHTLIAALLHHSYSHGAATLADIEKEFGEDVATMVKAIDSLRVIKLPELSREDFLESFRKMFLVMSQDMRVVLIKMADISDNLRTIESLRKEKQLIVARETLELFAPLAERLGMGELKGQMQDIAFKVLHPDEYEQVKKLLFKNREQMQRILLKLKGELNLTLTKEGIPFRIESRTKFLYSLYNKLKRDEINFDLEKIHDLIAFRIITDTTENCYRILGIIHKLWPAMSDYFNDYISHPKANGYQSIHTKVLGPYSRPFEIQIRTEEMHNQADYGVAAHWHYAESKTRGTSDHHLTQGIVMKDKKLEWVKTLANWQEEITDNEEFLKSVKTDFFGERIFVFTPKGDVKDLPKGATPIDFAYAVHSDLGQSAVGSIVNGKMVGLNSKLKNSDICEIVVSKDKKRKPSRDWLRFVVTTSAKKKIRHALLEN